MSYFPAFMRNERWWGSDKSSENRFAVHGIRHVPHPSSFPMNAEKRDSFLKFQNGRDFPDLTLQISLSTTLYQCSFYNVIYCFITAFICWYRHSLCVRDRTVSISWRSCWLSMHRQKRQENLWNAKDSWMDSEKATGQILNSNKSKGWIWMIINTHHV